MVALLRGKQYANSFDVMTYLQSFDGLMYKMTRVDAATIPKEFAEKLRPELDTLKNAFTLSSSADYSVTSEFLPFHSWTETFIQVIGAANNERDIDEKLKLNAERMKAHEKEKEKEAAVVSDMITVFNYENRKREIEKIEGFVKRAEEKGEERRAYIIGLQERYKDFETVFFDQINTYKKRSMVV